MRGGVGLVDRRDLGVVEVSGRDRASFLNALLSNDVKALAAGQGCQATLLDIHGKVQALLIVWVFEDRVLLITPPGLAADTVDRLDHYLFSEKVSLADVTAEWALFMLAGPGALDVVERLTQARPAAAAWSNVAATLDGTAVRLVMGGGETGAAEVWVAAPALAAAAILSALTAAGAGPVNGDALESLRVEAGTLRFGSDLGPAVLLPEVPSEHLLSHSKGCYPGQEVVVRIRDRGHVNRHLRGLVMDGDTVPQRGDEVVAGETVIGAVTERHALLGPRAPDRPGPGPSRARRARHHGRRPGRRARGPGQGERAAVRALTASPGDSVSTNRLANETSPYLLQHAHNPVDWYPWGEEALARARAEDKPILLSIGYSACHWCHVMEHESFEDPDRRADERALRQHQGRSRGAAGPRRDLHAGRAAVTGHGGWPMTVFLTPDGRAVLRGHLFPAGDRARACRASRSVLQRSPRPIGAARATWRSRGAAHRARSARRRRERGATRPLDASLFERRRALPSSSTGHAAASAARRSFPSR